MRLLHLDTRFRQNVTAPSGTPVFQLQGGPIRTSKLRLVSATIPVSWYTFTSADNTFVITLTGGSATTVTVAPGFIYTLTGLATAVQSAINSALGISTFTVTASTSSLQLILMHPSVGFSLTFASDRTAEVLGFDRAGAYATIGSDVFLSSTHVCELTTPSVHITGSLGASSYHPATGDTSVPLFVVPVTEDGGGVIVWNERTAYEQAIDFDRSRHLSQLSFELRDVRGRVLSPSLNWSLTLAYEQDE
jgi:hypothetical protein